MSSLLPTPQASRLTKPSWKDTRLILGILLVLTSIVLGALAFRAMDDRTGVWAAKADMVPGDVVTEEDLVRVDVQLGDGAASYLRTSEALPQEAVVDRVMRPGEILPRGALVDRSAITQAPVPVHVDPIYLAGLTKGSRVTLYAATNPPSGASSAPREEALEYEVVLERVEVQQLPERRGNVIGGSGSSASVVVLVPQEEVGRVLSLDREDAPIKLVAEGGSLPQEDAE